MDKLKKTKKILKKGLKKFIGLFTSDEKEEPETKKEWIKREGKDWAISIAVAVVIYFVILPAILNTSSPLIVVSSCSEEPYLDIGNVLAIQGTQVKNVKAPTIDLQSNEINYSFNAQKETLTINGKDLKKNESNEIVVYYSNPGGSQIIHRALAKIKTQNQQYLLTWGDANPIPDQLTQKKMKGKRRLCLQNNPGACISTPINNKMLVGKKLGWRVPLLGHVKLFFCDIFPVCEGHANQGTDYEYKLTC